MDYYYLYKDEIIFGGSLARLNITYVSAERKVQSSELIVSRCYFRIKHSPTMKKVIARSADHQFARTL